MNSPVKSRLGTADGASAEGRLRVELAGAYRLAHYYGWDELIFNHITARVPGRERYFLINDYGLRYDEVRASNLLKIDLEGRLVEGPADAMVNPAGFVIHSAIHTGREDILCAMHTHTVAGAAVSAMECGLLPVTLESMLFTGCIGYHDFEGITVQEDEKPRLVKALGNNVALILRNHGLLTVGRTVAEAFLRMFHLQRACEVQVAALQAGVKLTLPPEEIQRRVVKQGESFETKKSPAQRPFEAMLRLMDGIDASYRT